MGLGVPLACGSQCQPPAAYLPLAAGVPDQPLNLRFTLHSFTAFMAQLSECLVVHHGVPSLFFGWDASRSVQMGTIAVLTK